MDPSNITMRAKLRVTSVQRGLNAEEQVVQEYLRFNAVGPEGPYGADGSDENNTFARFTPAAELKMSVVNPALFGQFEEGDEFYVNFVRAAKG